MACVVRALLGFRCGKLARLRKSDWLSLVNILIPPLERSVIAPAGRLRLVTGGSTYLSMPVSSIEKDVISQVLQALVNVLAQPRPAGKRADYRFALPGTVVRAWGVVFIPLGVAVADHAGRFERTGLKHLRELGSACLSVRQEAGRGRGCGCGCGCGCRSRVAVAGCGCGLGSDGETCAARDHAPRAQVEGGRWEVVGEAKRRAVQVLLSQVQ